jgi:hypothetical protein
MSGDFGGFFTTARPSSPAGPPGTPSGAPPPAPARSPILGIAALVLVVSGFLVTMLGGNQGGLLGMPALLLGLVLGAIAWGRGLGKVWGQAAVFGVFGLIGLSLLLELLRL